MRARKVKVVMMRTMVTMVTTQRMAQVAHPKPNKEKKKKTKPKPPKSRKYPKRSWSPNVSEEALSSRIAEATEHMTVMELFKQASAYSKQYLIKLCENLCVNGMSSETIPEILRALEDRSKSGGFTIQKLFPATQTATELQTRGHINEQHSTGIYCCSMLAAVVACGAHICRSTVTTFGHALIGHAS